jgi:hypothetical protein
MTTEARLIEEVRGSIDFFRDFTNLDPNSQGYGLTVDCTRSLQIASVAAVGFALSAWVIACERGLLSPEQARTIVRGTLRTLHDRVSHYRGFFAHFLDMHTGERAGKCEYSTIDTGLCLNGVITAAAYFQPDAEIEQLAAAILDRVDWGFFVFEQDSHIRLRMAYNPDRGGDYVTDEPGFIGQWDMAAEQKMLYLQAANRLAPETARRLYRGFRRDTGVYNGRTIIINPGGTLFAYQFSEAWLDVRRFLDPDGIDWFENTRLAALANRQFCLDHAGDFATYSENSWGVSAGDSPWGYDVSGAAPAIIPQTPNGTVSIYSALASLPFVPDLTLAMIDHLDRAHPATRGRYGFFDSYNLAVTPPWHSNALYGIDKGCSLLMIENYLSSLIWDVYTNSAPIQHGLAVIGFQQRSTLSQEQ